MGMMNKMGFHEKWASLVMIYISFASYSILINGELFEHIILTQGLWQGDFLSPFLFLIYAKGLSMLLKKAESRDAIHRVRIYKEAPFA